MRTVCIVVSKYGPMNVCFADQTVSHTYLYSRMNGLFIGLLYSTVGYGGVRWGGMDGCL